MILVQASKASELSGLSPHQLREWCGRREILCADVEGQGPGRHALYSWQTILVLRILAELRNQYRIEISSWSDFGQTFRHQLDGMSFIQLWGSRLHIADTSTISLVFAGQPTPTSSGIFVQLDPHLEVLAMGMDMPRPDSQLPLFAAMRHK